MQQAKLEGRLQSLLPEFINGQLVETKECVPVELLRRPDPLQSTTLDNLQRSVDQLNHEVEQLKSTRH